MFSRKNPFCFARAVVLFSAPLRRSARQALTVSFSSDGAPLVARHLAFVGCPSVARVVLFPLSPPRFRLLAAPPLTASPFSFYPICTEPQAFFSRLRRFLCRYYPSCALRSTSIAPLISVHSPYHYQRSSPMTTKGAKARKIQRQSVKCAKRHKSTKKAPQCGARECVSRETLIFPPPQPLPPHFPPIHPLHPIISQSYALGQTKAP